MITYEKLKTSPWGAIQYQHTICEGIISVGTASHGGIHLDRKHQAAMPDYMKNSGPWYEEDCDWAKPFVVFSTEIIDYCINNPDENSRYNLASVEKAKSNLKCWHPDEYEQFFGEIIPGGESYVKDQRNFTEKHKNDFIVISACGSWHSTVPAGFVGVYAIRGRDEQKRLLVPESEYKNRGQFGFVIEKEYQEWPKEEK